MKVQVKRQSGPTYNVAIKGISWQEVQRLIRILRQPSWSDLAEEIEQAVIVEQPLPDTTGIANY